MRNINGHQKSVYAEYERQGSERYFKRYEAYLSAFKDRDTLRILDIGGASGYFAMQLKSHFQNKNVEIYVLDITEYDTWRQAEFGRDIHFVCDSVENIGTIFQKNFFDMIFANRVFHHFVDESWKKTLAGMETSMKLIRQLLRRDGVFFVMDHFYDGLICDAATSFLIYHATSIKLPLLAGLVKKLGADTAGVGVCFQSEKMWTERIQKCGFRLNQIERSPCDKVRFLKRLLLLIKKARRNNVICAVPNCEKEREQDAVNG